MKYVSCYIKKVNIMQNTQYVSTVRNMYKAIFTTQGQQYILYISTLATLFSIGAFDSFLAGLDRNPVHSALQCM